MKGAIDDGKEISPMFPRLHVKDAEKGGPKAPPRNKMALYEQFTIPSQSFSSGSGSLFSLPLRNCTVPSISSHVSQVGSNQSIQFCTTNAPSILAEQIQEYNSRKIEFTKLMQGSFINSKTSLKTLCGEDGFITSSPGHGKNSCCSLIKNDKDEDKLGNRNSSCSIKSLSSFRKKMNSLEAIEPMLIQYGKNQIEENLEASRVGQKAEEGSADHKLDGFGDMNDDESLNSKPMKKEIISLNDEIRSISGDSFRVLLGSNAQTHKDQASFGDSINLGDSCFEKLPRPAAIDLHKYPDELEIGQRCFLSRRNMNNDEETYRHYDAFNKPISECILGTDIISPDNVRKVIGEKQFWKARRTIINQQKIFILQVFELHRLIEVQRTIAGSPHLLHEDNFLFNKTPLQPSAFKKLQTDYLADRSSLLKLDSKLENPTTAAEDAKGDTISKIPLPCISSMSKIIHANNQIPNYEHHHLRNHSTLTGLDTDAAAPKLPHPSSCVYPPPGNQWLVPVMSPSEGLVYKPIMGPCPPNAGFMPPIYGTVSLNPTTKDVPDSTLGPNPHHRIGILSGSSLPHHFLPPLMHQSISHSAIEQMGQSNNCPENQLHRSQTSQVMPKNVANHHHNHNHQSPLKDKELQRSTASSPSSKRMKCDVVLPLFPVAPTFWPPSTTDNNRNTQQQLDDDHHNNQQQQQNQNQNHTRVIKAMPHNPKSATESAARIFRSIQEERKNIYN